jgi:site-specific recombinase XerC
VVAYVDLCVTRSIGLSGQLVPRLGRPELDRYLDFVAGRCRPNTVLATAYDLKVFFCVVGKPPAEVTTGDVLGFITAQRHGGAGRLQLVGDGQGVSDRSVRRRLSTISGLFAYLHARGDVAVNPVPRGLPTRREKVPSTTRRPVDPPAADAAEDPDTG